MLQLVQVILCCLLTFCAASKKNTISKTELSRRLQGCGRVTLHRFFWSPVGHPAHFYTTNYQEGINAGMTYEGAMGQLEGCANYHNGWYMPLKRYYSNHIPVCKVAEGPPRATIAKQIEPLPRNRSSL